MKNPLKNNQIVIMTVGSVLATAITTWLVNFKLDLIYSILPTGARATTFNIVAGSLPILLAAATTLYASRLGRVGAGQRVIEDGFAPQLKLLMSPERASDDVSLKAIEKLERMVGLVPVKRQVNTLLARLQFEQKRLDQGHSSQAIGMHMVFTGPPGVGKTEVARALGDILRTLNVVKSGHLVQVAKEDLVAGYIGQTAIQTMKKCREALDGILFIDEAYSLANSPDGVGDFGKEAITTLMKFMDDNRDRMIVIVAGYPNEMRQLMGSNPGLTSRFTNYIDFPDYSPKELCEIFRRMAAQQGFFLPDGFEPKVTTWIRSHSRVDGWANAREMRTLLEKTREAQAVRLVSHETMDVSTIDMADIMSALQVLGGK